MANVREPVASKVFSSLLLFACLWGIACPLLRNIQPSVIASPDEACITFKDRNTGQPIWVPTTDAGGAPILCDGLCDVNGSIHGNCKPADQKGATAARTMVAPLRRAH